MRRFINRKVGDNQGEQERAFRAGFRAAIEIAMARIEEIQADAGRPMIVKHTAWDRVRAIRNG